MFPKSFSNLNLAWKQGMTPYVPEALVGIVHPQIQNWQLEIVYEIQ